MHITCTLHSEVYAPNYKAQASLKEGLIIYFMNMRLMIVPWANQKPRMMIDFTLQAHTLGWVGLQIFRKPILHLLTF